MLVSSPAECPGNIPLASPTLDLNSRHFTSVFCKPYRLSKKQYCLVECPRISYLMSKHCIGFSLNDVLTSGKNTQKTKYWIG